jgi:hypothetical protein
MIAFYVYVLQKHGLGQHRLLAAATIALFVLCTAHCVLVLAAIVTRSALKLERIAHLAGALSPKLQLILTVGRLSLAANIVYVTAKCVPHVSRSSLLVDTPRTT